MKSQYKLAIVMLLLCSFDKLSAGGSLNAPLVNVQHAAIIAFHPPVSKVAIADPDSNESLSDFRLYAGLVKQPLAKSGIRVQVLYAQSFRVHLGALTTTFHPRVAVGYYLIALGKEPDVEYGVMTDTDLLLVAKRYFGSDSLAN
jgi:hypothetical protein